MDTPQFDPEQKEALYIAMRNLMSCWSEENYCAGWLSGLEFMLWERVLKNDPEETIQSLKVLSQLSNGWVRWDDDKCEKTFISLQEWENLFSKYKESR